MCFFHPLYIESRFCSRPCVCHASATIHIMDNIREEIQRQHDFAVKIKTKLDALRHRSRSRLPLLEPRIRPIYPFAPFSHAPAYSIIGGPSDLDPFFAPNDDLHPIFPVAVPDGGFHPIFPTSGPNLEGLSEAELEVKLTNTIRCLNDYMSMYRRMLRGNVSITYCSYLRVCITHNCGCPNEIARDLSA